MRGSLRHVKALAALRPRLVTLPCQVVTPAATLVAHSQAQPAARAGSHFAVQHVRCASGQSEASSCKCSRCSAELLTYHPYSMLSTTVRTQIRPLERLGLQRALQRASGPS